jgi:hypothetical protein
MNRLVVQIPPSRFHLRHAPNLCRHINFQLYNFSVTHRSSPLGCRGAHCAPNDFIVPASRWGLATPSEAHPASARKDARRAATQTIFRCLAHHEPPDSVGAQQNMPAASACLRSICTPDNQSHSARAADRGRRGHPRLRPAAGSLRPHMLQPSQFAGSSACGMPRSTHACRHDADERTCGTPRCGARCHWSSQAAPPHQHRFPFPMSREGARICWAHRRHS